ncbi:MAG: hypothetical protein JSV09_11300 [Thermoplasmata archaeon]|nr:MAG: hypothetical protein JSV09_11300 [Thermoplasmata archaeon]
MNEDIIYDESDSEKAMNAKKDSKKKARSNIINLIFICFLGPIPPIAVIYYQDVIGDVFAVYFFSIPIFIAIGLGIYINLRIIYLKMKYNTYDVKVSKENIYLPSDRTKAIFSPEFITVHLKDIENIFWNPLDKEEFLITFYQKDSSKEYAPLYISKQLIYSPVKFFKVLKENNVNIDIATEIAFGYFYKKYKNEKKIKGVKWVLNHETPFIHYINSKKPN